MKIGGKTVKIRPAKAREYFDIQDSTESERDFNRQMMALCAETGGKPAFTPDEVEDLDLPDWQTLEAAVAKVNKPAEEDKKK